MNNRAILRPLFYFTLRNTNQRIISTWKGEPATNSSQSPGIDVKICMNSNSIVASVHKIMEQVIALVTLVPHIAENTVRTTEEANAAHTKDRYSY